MVWVYDFLDNFAGAYPRQYSASDVIVKAMESKPNVSDGQKNDQKSAEPEALGVVLATIGDTTWRMFVPSVGLTLLGVWADSQLQTKPWLMVAGIALGCFGAFLLVKKQISVIKSRKESSK